MKRIKDYIRNNGGTICVLLALVLFLILGKELLTFQL